MINKRTLEHAIEETLEKYTDETSLLAITKFMSMLSKLHTYSLISDTSSKTIFDYIAGDDQDTILSLILTTINSLSINGTNVSELQKLILDNLSDLTNSMYYTNEFKALVGTETNIDDNILVICMLYRLNMKLVKSILEEAA